MVYHNYIPVPDTVRVRQAASYEASKKTKALFGTTGPYEWGSPEFKLWFWFLKQEEECYAQ